MEMKTVKEKIYFLDYFVLFLITLFSILYSIFISNFAELHISVSFLPFPVFVGELLLVFCGCMFILKLVLFQDIRLRNFHIASMLFYVFILIKAFWGYFSFSPLAFRNAALFYYSLFGFIGYYFYKLPSFNIRHFFLTIVIFSLFLLLFTKVVHYYYFFYMMSSLFFINKFVYKKILRFIAYTFVILFFISKIPHIATRGITIAFLCGLFFCSAIYFLYFFKMRYKAVAVYVGILFIAFMIVFKTGVYSKKSVFIRTFVSIPKYLTYYKNISEEMANIKDYPENEEFILRLYTDNKGKNPALLKDKDRTDFFEKKKIEAEKKEYPIFNINIDGWTTKDKNVLWRMFVIGDALKKVVRDRCIFGEPFGKPLRSRSLEILRVVMPSMGSATGYWVGWLEPHNSYVHMIYRAGIVAFVFIGAILFLFFKMTIGFVRMRNFNGVLLLSVIFYWLVVANFEVVLELPYFAIPFWSLFGIAYKYFEEKKDEHEQKKLQVEADL